MKKAMSCRKRPCRICKRWFSPHPRLRDRQTTCGEEACKREWHRRKCAEWYRENSGQIRKERLAHRLKAIVAGSEEANVTDQVPPGPTPLQGPRKTQHLLPRAQEVIAAQLAVMFEYLLRQLLKRAQDVMMRQPFVNTG